ncbi:hypothetical protein L2E82_51253 [Cichorium intybus]|nr:hypothetical protein L2E82_51253 [Cichorium intybus]
MASSSSSTFRASPAANGSSYDVFLSFRGEDTRDSFADHLFDALKRAGIGTFRDNEEINRGEDLKPEIETAVKRSRASIVVLSKNYATSTWCLDELMLILEQRRECGHFVLPVFYHVDPSDVRNQNATFAIEVKASSRWTNHNVNLWKKALKEVADLAGMVLSGPETEFLKEIVDTIYNKLDRKEVHLPINLTGMATRYKDIHSWLHRSDAKFLAICGMGGSGKTTLARYIVYSNCQNFESISIVEDIGSRCKEPHDLLQIQEKLFADISGGKKRKIPSVCQGTFKIEEALQVKKALIVLDDIVEPSQLAALLGCGDINPQSKIIITSRKNNIGKWIESRSWGCQEYQMKLLDDDESLELLSRHAFGSKTQMEGYEELSKQVLQYCEGNPLALEVLGSSLAQDNSILFWKSTLSLLGRDINVGIQRVLIRSYNSLPHDSNKELFLHIACFFVGKDMDYVVKILEHDYSAVSGIKTLTNRCLLSVSSNKKLMMHPLLQEMGRTIVHQESPKDPAKRSRVWLNKDSYDVLRKGKGSETMEGLALDMQMLKEEKYAFKSSNLKTDALEKMDKLKLLQLNFVQMSGSYGKLSEDLRWLCWLGFHLRTIPSDLFMGNLVAIDMSYSNIEIFEPPMVLQSLQILNLKDSYNLSEIRNMSMIPHLETLILWNCHNLVRVCETIKDLTSLALLNMTGCKNLCKMEQTHLLVGVEASTSGGRVAEQSSFSFPHSLHQLFLKDCSLECNKSFPLSFSVQISLQYLNLGNSLFEFLPCYDHLKNLRVLDLSLCARLKWLLCLPSTLAELYIYYCMSLEKISFQSHRFTLQEFGYEGCISLSEIEGFIKLVPVAKLEENDLGHMKWLKEYQNCEVRLVGDDELTIGRSLCLQMVYEFNIMSTSLPNIKDPNMKPEYVSRLSSLSFDVPLCPKNKSLKGLDVTIRYTISDDNDWGWFCKISTNNGVDLMYNPKVFGRPDCGEVGIWLSYWPIGNTLNVGDKINVSIIVMSGVEVHECGVSLFYTDDKEPEENLENNKGWIEIIGGDLSGFELSTGAYYLCRRDFFELMEVDRQCPDWFRILVGDTIDYTEVRGWRKTGRPKQMNTSFTELKTVRCIVHGPELEEIYKITEMSKSSSIDKPLESTSSMLGEMMKSATSSTSTDTTMQAGSKPTMETLEEENLITNEARKISVDLGTRLTPMATVPEDEVHEDEELSDIKGQINSIQEKIMIWERDESMIWDSNPEQAKEYLRTVVEAKRLSEVLESLNLTEDDRALLRNVNALLQSSMAKIEEKFRDILIHNCQNFEPEHSVRFSFFSSEDDGLYENSVISYGDNSNSIDSSFQGDSIISHGAEVLMMDIVNPVVIPDLKGIANSMFDSNCGRECSQAFISVRKDALDDCLLILEIEKLSVEDIIKMEWVVLNSKIKRWIKGIKIFVRILDFAEAITVGPHQPENLLRILEMYEVLSDLMPDIEKLYSDENGFYIRSQYRDVLTRVGDYVKATSIEFKKAVEGNSSNTAFPGGGIHHLTRYVMNYIKSLTNFRDSLNMCLKDERVGDNQESSSSPYTSPHHEDDSINVNSSSSPMALYFGSELRNRCTASIKGDVN